MSSTQEPSEDETVSKIGPAALRLAPPESWERAFAQRCQASAASLRVYNQHGRGQGYRVVEADLELVAGEPPRWEVSGIIGDEDARELATEPLTRSQVLALCVQAGLDEAGDHKVGEPPRTPKDVVIRVVIEDARGEVLINVSRRYDLVRGRPNDDAGDDECATIELADQESERASGYIPAGPLVDRLLGYHEQLIRHALDRPAAPADPAMFAEQMQMARRAGFAEGYLAAVQKMEKIVGRRRSSDDDFDDDDGADEYTMSPHRQKLLETMPEIARELSGSMKDVGIYAVDRIEKLLME